MRDAEEKTGSFRLRHIHQTFKELVTASTWSGKVHLVLLT